MKIISLSINSVTKRSITPHSSDVFTTYLYVHKTLLVLSDAFTHLRINCQINFFIDIVVVAGNKRVLIFKTNLIKF